MVRWLLVVSVLGACKDDDGTDSDTSNTPSDHFLLDEDWFWGELTGNVGTQYCSDHGILEEMATSPTTGSSFTLSLVEEAVHLNCTIGADNTHTCARFQDDRGSFDEIVVTTSADGLTLTLSFTEYSIGNPTPCATPVIVGQRLNGLI